MIGSCDSQSLEKAGRLDEAIEQHEKLTQLQPKGVDSLYALANLYANKKNDQKLIETYRRILKIEPKKADLHDKLASLLTEKKSYVEAINHYQVAVHCAPQNLTYRINLARVYEKTGDLKKALAEFKAVYELNPNSREAKERIPALNLEILRRKHKKTE